MKILVHNKRPQLVKINPEPSAAASLINVALLWDILLTISKLNQFRITLLESLQHLCYAEKWLSSSENYNTRGHLYNFLSCANNL